MDTTSNLLTIRSKLRFANPVKALVSSLLALSLSGMPTAPLVAAPVATAGPEYRLGPLDKLRVRVLEWRPSKDEVFEWSALKEDYSVGAAGSLNLPLLGDVPANGLTTSELARLIGERMKDRLGMIDPPDTAVEIVQYRPFYIIGQVDKPGEYPFRPGLTVLQAISVAGGMQRVSDMGLFRLERDAISAKGELLQIATEVNSLKSRKSRLDAELKNAGQIEFAKELLDQKSQPTVVLLMDQENRIFEARRKGLETQLEALAQLKTYLKSEIDSLTAQIGKEDTQIKLVQKELDSVQTLVEKGLSAAPRQLLLQRTIAQIEGERLRLNTSVVKAQQDISKTDIAILDLKNKWTNDITAELRQTQAALDQQANKAQISNNLLREAIVTAPQFIADRARSAHSEPILKIVRNVEGYPVETTVPETANVAPGDTIKVEMPIPEAPELSSLQSSSPTLAETSTASSFSSDTSQSRTGKDDTGKADSGKSDARPRLAAEHASDAAIPAEADAGRNLKSLQARDASTIKR